MPARFALKKFSAIQNIAIAKMIDLKAKAKQGDKESQYILAQYYTEGHSDVEKDLQKAVTYYQRAAKQGYVAAKFYLAQCCENGSGIGKNLELAK